MSKYKPEGFIRGSKLVYTEDEIIEAINSNKILEGMAIRSDSNNNLYVELGNNICGVIPYDEFDYREDNSEVKGIQVMSKVGKIVAFKVIKVEINEQGKKCIVLSRRLAQIDCKKNYINSLTVGQVIDAKIVHLEGYGAFCDIGCGIIALLPIKNLCISRVEDLRKEIRNIKNIKVVIKSIDSDGKITLTHKELLGTWEEEVSKFNVDDTLIGIVRTITDYGVFVELTPNLSGLAKSRDGIKPGDRVAVAIKDIDSKRMKIKLLIISDEPIDKFIGYEEFNYKYTNDIIEYWEYSSKEADRKIETIFR